MLTVGLGGWPQAGEPQVTAVLLPEANLRVEVGIDREAADQESPGPWGAPASVNDYQPIRCFCSVSL